MYHTDSIQWVRHILGTLFLTILSNTVMAAPPIYWCPNKPADQQYSASQDADCVPLVKKKDPEKETTSTKNEPKRTVDLNNLQHEVSGFLQRYNDYVACCSTDPSTLDELTELETHANDLLDAIQAGLSGENIKVYGMKMLGPVNRANYNLQSLKARLITIGNSMDRMPSLGYDEAGVERQRIQEEQEAISKHYGPLDVQGSGNTGTEILNTTLPTQVGSSGGTSTTSTSLPTQTGGSIGSTGSDDGFARTGTDIGNGSSSGVDIGHTPSTGLGIGDNNDNVHAGPNIGK